MRIWRFEIDDIDSDLCGKEFLMSLGNVQKTDAYKSAQRLFPNLHLHCLGYTDEFETEDEALSL